MELHITNCIGSEFPFTIKMILFTSLFLTFARADDSGKISDGVHGDRDNRNNFLAESKIYFKGAS